MDDFKPDFGCSTEGCDSQGHVNGRFSRHRTAANCPLARKRWHDFGNDGDGGPNKKQKMDESIQRALSEEPDTILLREVSDIPCDVKIKQEPEDVDYFQQAKTALTNLSGIPMPDIISIVPETHTSLQEVPISVKKEVVDGRSSETRTVSLDFSKDPVSLNDADILKKIEEECERVQGSVQKQLQELLQSHKQTSNILKTHLAQNVGIKGTSVSNSIASISDIVNVDQLNMLELEEEKVQTVQAIVANTNETVSSKLLKKAAERKKQQDEADRASPVTTVVKRELSDDSDDDIDDGGDYMVLAEWTDGQLQEAGSSDPEKEGENEKENGDAAEPPDTEPQIIKYKNTLIQNKCPNPGCKGLGHITGLYTHHRSFSGCPNKATAPSDLFTALELNQNAFSRCPTPGCSGRGHINNNRGMHRSVSGCPIAAMGKLVMGSDGKRSKSNRANYHLVVLPKHDDQSKAILAACTEKQLIKLAAKQLMNKKKGNSASDRVLRPMILTKQLDLGGSSGSSTPRNNLVKELEKYNRQTGEANSSTADKSEKSSPEEQTATGEEEMETENETQEKDVPPLPVRTQPKERPNILSRRSRMRPKQRSSSTDSASSTTSSASSTATTPISAAPSSVAPQTSTSAKNPVLPFTDPNFEMRFFSRDMAPISAEAALTIPNPAVMSRLSRQTTTSVTNSSNSSIPNVSSSVQVATNSSNASIPNVSSSVQVSASNSTDTSEDTTGADLTQLPLMMPVEYHRRTVGNKEVTYPVPSGYVIYKQIDKQFNEKLSIDAKTGLVQGIFDGNMLNGVNVNSMKHSCVKSTNHSNNDDSMKHTDHVYSMTNTDVRKPLNNKTTKQVNKKAIIPVNDPSIEVKRYLQAAKQSSQINKSEYLAMKAQLLHQPVLRLQKLPEEMTRHSSVKIKSHQTGPNLSSIKIQSSRTISQLSFSKIKTESDNSLPKTALQSVLAKRPQIVSQVSLLKSSQTLPQSTLAQSPQTVSQISLIKTSQTASQFSMSKPSQPVSQFLIPKPVSQFLMPKPVSQFSRKNTAQTVSPSSLKHIQIVSQSASTLSQSSATQSLVTKPSQLISQGSVTKPSQIVLQPSLSKQHKIVSQVPLTKPSQIVLQPTLSTQPKIVSQVSLSKASQIVLQPSLSKQLKIVSQVPSTKPSQIILQPSLSKHPKIVSQVPFTNPSQIVLQSSLSKQSKIVSQVSLTKASQTPLQPSLSKQPMIVSQVPLTNPSQSGAQFSLTKISPTVSQVSLTKTLQTETPCLVNKVQTLSPASFSKLLSISKLKPSSHCSPKLSSYPFLKIQPAPSNSLANIQPFSVLLQSGLPSKLEVAQTASQSSQTEVEASQTTTQSQTPIVHSKEKRIDASQQDQKVLVLHPQSLLTEANSKPQKKIVVYPSRTKASTIVTESSPKNKSQNIIIIQESQIAQYGSLSQALQAMNKGKTQEQLSILPVTSQTLKSPVGGNTRLINDADSIAMSSMAANPTTMAALKESLSHKPDRLEETDVNLTRKIADMYTTKSATKTGINDDTQPEKPVFLNQAIPNTIAALKSSLIQSESASVGKLSPFNFPDIIVTDVETLQKQQSSTNSHLKSVLVNPLANLIHEKSTLDELRSRNSVSDTNVEVSSDKKAVSIVTIEEPSIEQQDTVEKVKFQRPYPVSIQANLNYCNNST